MAMAAASTSTMSSGAYSSNSEHLRDELHRVEGLVRAHLLRFKDACPEDQRERYWHIPDAQLDRIATDEAQSVAARFATTPAIDEILRWVDARRGAIDAAVAATGAGPDLRVARLVREFGLTAAERDGLLLAALPALHSTYRRWYGVLQADPARAYATVAFLAELLARRAEDLDDAQAVFGPRERLARNRLITLLTEDEPFGARTVVADERVVQFLNGRDLLDARLSGVARWHPGRTALRDLPLPGDVANRLELLPSLRALDRPAASRLRLEFLGPDPGLAERACAAVAAGFDQGLLVVDVQRALASGVAWPIVVDAALREARLVPAMTLVTHVSMLMEEGDAGGRLAYLLERLADHPHPAALEAGAPAVEDSRTAADWLSFRLPAPTVAMRERLWSVQLAQERQLPEPRTIVRDLASAFQLTDSQIRDAAQAARALARRRDPFAPSLGADDLFVACRRLSATRLVAFAQRIEPRTRLTLEHDVVLPPANKRALAELQGRIRNHLRVHGAMGLGPHLRLGRGVTAMFVGGSGTGKTIAAEVLASEQQVDLYRVDLAALTSKWVGETEKNLSKVFADAERANCMLFFDEADSMFGRRGEVREARDRWANLEVNYLLQRIEDYSGVVILATNLRQNIDDAFQRRIHVVVEFPVPDAASRRLFWARLLPGEAHLDVTPADLDDIALRFELTGGNIRNVVLDACFRALDAGSTSVSLRHLIASIAREYQKTARPVTQGDFGRYYDWAMRDVVAPPDLNAAAMEG